MATFDLGRVTPIYKGDYDAAASYELNDVVLYNGNLYWHTRATPTVGILPTDTAVWKLAFSDEGIRAEIRGYADDAAASETSAEASRDDAAASASAAQTSAAQAASSAQSALAAQNGASASVQTASTQAQAAASSAQSALASAQTASDKAQIAAQKAAAASEALSLAQTSAAQASASETNAAASETSANASATQAAASSTSAQTYAQAAGSSASAAAESESNASDSATAAAASASQAAESARSLTIDTTLAQSGQAADAKVVGDRLDRLDRLDVGGNLLATSLEHPGEYIANDGTFKTDTVVSYGTTCFYMIPVTPGSEYILTIKTTRSSGNWMGYGFYATKEISSFDSTTGRRTNSAAGDDTGDGYYTNVFVITVPEDDYYMAVSYRSYGDGIITLVDKNSFNEKISTLRTEFETSQVVSNFVEKNAINNIIPFTGDTTTHHGVTFTRFDNDTVSIKGTATGEAYFYLYNNFESLPEGISPGDTLEIQMVCEDPDVQLNVYGSSNGSSGTRVATVTSADGLVEVNQYNTITGMAFRVLVPDGWTGDVICLPIIHKKDVTDEINCVNSRIARIDSELYEDLEIVNRVNILNSYVLDTDGMVVSDPFHAIDRYTVTAGTLVHINVPKESDIVWAFKETSEGDSNLIGSVNVYGGSDYVVVPEGATYLFVVRLKTTGTTPIYVSQAKLTVDSSFVKGVNHRGYNKVAPENTIPAFELSKRAGFKYVETDVSFTSDNIPVLLHDASINRTARNANGTEIAETVNIEDITYEQALVYDFGIWMGDKYAGTKIPRFDNFIKWCKRSGIHPYIELKSSVMGGTAITEQQVIMMLGVVKACGMSDNVTWTSFDRTALTYVRDNSPKSRIGYIVRTEITSGIIANTKGLRSGSNEVFLDASYTLVTAEAVALAIAEDVPIEVWTVDSKSAIMDLDDYVTGVISNVLDASRIFYSE